MQTISEEYKELQKKLHENPNYGTASIYYAPVVANLIQALNIKSLSDYGAGKQNLFKALKELSINIPQYLPYDPAFPEYGSAKKAELICCIDVLEHIEPEFIDNVIKELSELTTNYGFFTVHMVPAKKKLEDGRNAHLIQEKSSWWLKKIVQYFDVIHLETTPTKDGFWIVVSKS